MSKQTIRASINTAKVDKDLLYQGKKGTYLNIALIETPDDQYGNTHMVVQDVSKEQREAGVRGEILGNAKTFGGNKESAPAAGGNPVDW